MMPLDARGHDEPGTVRTEGGQLLVHCGAGTWLDLVEVQLEGKKRMSAAEFLRGRQVQSGDKLNS